MHRFRKIDSIYFGKAKSEFQYGMIILKIKISVEVFPL